MHRVVESGGGRNTVRRYADHSLRPSSALRCRVPHGGPEKALRLQAIESGVKRADGAAFPGGTLDLLADGRAVSSCRRAARRR